MKLAIIGSKGIPAKYGGFETFAEELAIRLIKKHQVLVIGEANSQSHQNEYLKIKIAISRFKKADNPILFYNESLKLSRKWHADVVIMCGIGGVFSLPFHNNSKSKIIVNPDGIGWKRDKWDWWKKILIYLMYLFCAKFSRFIVCDSKGIMFFFQHYFNRKKNVFVAEYGSNTNLFIRESDNGYFKNKIGMQYGILKNEYYLIVSRLEPENNVALIIKGFLHSKSNVPLIIVGNTNTKYADYLQQFKSQNVQFVDGVYDAKKLSAMRFFCRAYFHGHSVGGTNPSLLEAMGSKNLTIAHDNIFNREVLDDNGYFFSTEDDFSSLIMHIESNNYQDEIECIKSKNLTRIQNYYNWDNITKKYLEIINKIIYEK